MKKPFSPKISIVIPVYKEPNLKPLLSHLMAIQKWEECEVIVVSADNEHHFNKYREQLHSRIFTPFADRIQLLHSSVKGRGVQMNCGAKVARGLYLLFLHADSHLESKSLVHMTQCLERGFAGGGFSLCIDGASRLYTLLSVATNWRARRTQVPYGDQGIFVRREVFESLGGYREIPIMEDVDFVKRLKKGGYPIQVLSNIIRTSPRRYQEKGILRQALTNRLLMLGYMLGVSPKVLSRYYYGSS
jgi:rSAM/selenodomain-associated transferase 2